MNEWLAELIHKFSFWILCGIITVIGWSIKASYDNGKRLDALEDHKREHEKIDERMRLEISQSWFRDGRIRDIYNDNKPDNTPSINWEGMPRTLKEAGHGHDH